MCLPPFFDDPEDARPFFVTMRRILEEIQAKGLAGESFRQVSMGMSKDYEIAVEEGATMVRIGTAIFGERNR